MTSPLYSYNADTKRAKLYSRTTGAVVCDVYGVNVYTGHLLERLADEMYKEGYAAGRRDAINVVAEHLAQMAKP